MVFLIIDIVGANTMANIVKYIKNNSMNCDLIILASPYDAEEVSGLFVETLIKPITFDDIKAMHFRDD